MRAGSLLVLIALLSPFAAMAQQEAGTKPVERLVGHGGPIHSIDMAPDGQSAVTGSFDYSIIQWSLGGVDGEITHRLIGHNAAVNDVALVPGKPQAVSVSDDGSFALWDLETGTLVKRFEDTADKVLDVAVSGDGRLAAIARWDGTARVFDLESLTEIAVMSGHTGNVNAVGFSVDGERLYTGSYDGTIREWDARSGSFIRLIDEHGWGINVLSVLPDGRHLIFGAIDGSLGLIDIQAAERERMLSLFERPVLAIAIAPNGAVVAAGDGAGNVHIFPTDSWQEIRHYPKIPGPVWGLAFSPDAGRIYTASLDDYVSGWKIDPENPFIADPAAEPRRFQVTETADPGELQFRRKCSVCHTLNPDDENRAGPTLHGLFGRRAGSLPGYPYSDALLDSDIIWNSETIGRLFDHGPDVVTPGTKMPIQRIKRVQDRESLIAYLKRATGPHQP